MVAKNVEGLLEDLQKKFGAESAMFASDIPPYQVFSSGSLGLDYATGIGGFPSNRVIEIGGEPGAGKSTLAMHAVNNRLIAEKQWGTNRGALYLDIENRITPEWMERFVEEPERVIVAKPDSMEQATDMYMQAVRSGLIGMAVVDSIGGAPTERVMDKSASVGDFGGNSLAVSRFAKFASTLSGKYNVTTLGINQIRDDLSGYRRYQCLSGDTEVLTNQGWRSIESLSGGVHTILTEGGRWVDAPINCFGEDEMWEIVVERYGVQHTVRTNAPHRWPVYRPTWLRQPDGRKPSHKVSKGACPDDNCPYFGKCHCGLCDKETSVASFSRASTGAVRGRPFQYVRGHAKITGRGHGERVRQFVTTENLIPGVDQLLPNTPRVPYKENLLRWAVAAGFVFGDGTKGSHGPRGQVSISKKSPKGSLVEYFNAFNVQEYEDRVTVTGFPNSMKDLPSLEEGPEFLFSWLAGYFAADGDVSKSDGVPRLTSVNRAHLEFVEDVCAIVGVPANGISRRRSGKLSYSPGEEYFEITFPVGSLPRSFFINPRHKDNFRERVGVEHNWKVVSVRNTGVVEPIYCAEVPETETFTIGRGAYLLTGNTPGGKAWIHATSLRVELKVRRQEGDKAYIDGPDGKEQIGYVVVYKIHKNSLGAPYKSGWYWFYNIDTPQFGFGLDQFSEVARLAISSGVVERASTQTYAHPSFGKINGRNNVMDRIKSDPGVFDAIVTDLQDRMGAGTLTGAIETFDEASEGQILVREPFAGQNASEFRTGGGDDA